MIKVMQRRALRKRIRALELIAKRQPLLKAAFTMALWDLRADLAELKRKRGTYGTA